MRRLIEKQYLVNVTEKIIFGHSIAKQAVKVEYV